MGMVPYYGGNPQMMPGVSNALTGMAGPRRLQVQNALQPQGMPMQQHPMMFPMPQQGGWQQPQVPMQQPVQWPNPHQGAYDEWMQKFRGGPNGMRTMMR